MHNTLLKYKKPITGYEEVQAQTHTHLEQR